MSKDDIKIHLMCSNIFLLLTLSFYLRGHLGNIKEADFILSDDPNYTHHKPICVIGIDLIMPCSVYEIFLQLHDFYATHRISYKEQILKTEKVQLDTYNLINDFKNQNMEEIIKHANPAMKAKIEELLNDFKNKLTDELRNVK